jgi:1-deoxy-D-xylulose-5-phosphate reductoisomerase
MRHPRWSMGPKISVDSATMFNKGLEAIEISRLFDLSLDRVEIVVQPESAVHSLVEFIDGSMLAQLGPTDMRVSISQALFHPALAPVPASRLDLDGLSLHFQKPAAGDWPCLDVALEAGTRGGTLPAVVGAADEVLVQAFLEGRIGFGSIGRGLEAALAAHAPHALDSGASPALDRLIEADAWGRAYARRWPESVAGRAGAGQREQPGGNA